MPCGRYGVDAVWRRVTDAAVVLVVIAWGQADVWAPSVTQPTDVVGPRLVLSAAYLSAGLALLARRARPLVATIAVFGVLAIPMVAYGASENLGAFLPPLLVIYSLGAHADLRRALCGLGIAAAWSVVFLLRDPTLHNAADYARSTFYLSLFALPWAFGLLVRNPRLRAIEWEMRATRMERERRDALESAILAERAHIARELHDVVSHTVGLIVLQAQAGDTRIETDPAAARSAFHAIESSARGAMVELRRMLGLLRNDVDHADLAPQPGLAHLPALVEDLRAAGLDVRVTVSGRHGDISRGLELNAFRIVQEALTNSLRHAGATVAEVRIAFTEEALELEVTDNGRPSAAVPGRGHGLVGMQERVQVHGGRLEHGRRDGAGFRVWARLPLEATPA